MNCAQVNDINCSEAVLARFNDMTSHITLFNPTTDEKIRKLVGHTSTVTSMIMIPSPAESSKYWLASGSYDDTIKILKPVKKFEL